MRSTGSETTQFLLRKQRLRFGLNICILIWNAEF